MIEPLGNDLNDKAFSEVRNSISWLGKEMKKERRKAKSKNVWVAANDHCHGGGMPGFHLADGDKPEPVLDNCHRIGR